MEYVHLSIDICFFFGGWFFFLKHKFFFLFSLLTENASSDGVTRKGIQLVKFVIRYAFTFLASDFVNIFVYFDNFCGKEV